MHQLRHILSRLWSYMMGCGLAAGATIQSFRTTAYFLETEPENLSALRWARARIKGMYRGFKLIPAHGRAAPASVLAKSPGLRSPFQVFSYLQPCCGNQL